MDLAAKSHTLQLFIQQRFGPYKVIATFLVLIWFGMSTRISHISRTK